MTWPHFILYTWSVNIRTDVQPDFVLVSPTFKRSNFLFWRQTASISSLHYLLQFHYHMGSSLQIANVYNIKGLWIGLSDIKWWVYRLQKKQIPPLFTSVQVNLQRSVETPLLIVKSDDVIIMNTFYFLYFTSTKALPAGLLSTQSAVTPGAGSCKISLCSAAPAVTITSPYWKAKASAENEQTGKWQVQTHLWRSALSVLTEFLWKQVPHRLWTKHTFIC